MPGVPDGLLRDTPRTPTLRAFQAECLGSLELLEQLLELQGDFNAAKGVSQEIAGIAEKLRGGVDWQVARAREDVRRLDRLASLDRDRIRAIEAARKATALVATAQGSLGTAFCIDPQGLFLTLDEVANPPSAQVTTHFEYEQGIGLSRTREERSPQTHPMAVVLNLGSPDVKQLPVRIIWKDKESRLVLLKAETRGPLPALELAGPGGVAPGKEVVAVGLPAVGRVPHLAASPTPTVRARPGSVASIRTKEARPWFYQLDIDPPPGYAGGPVLDEQGRVTGVIAQGLPGTDIHYILPIDATFSPLAVDFEPLRPLFRDRHTPVDWTVRIYSRTPMPKDATVEVRLGTGAAGRVFPARPTGERTYTTRVVPVPPEESDPVGLTLAMRPEALRATIADREVRVGATAVRLSQLRRIEQGPSPRALTVDGRRLIGPVTGLGVIEGGRGHRRVRIDPGEAPAIWLECPAPEAEPIEAEVVAKAGGVVLGRIRKTLSYADPPFQTSRHFDPAKVGVARIWRPVSTSDVAMAAADVSREPRAATGSPPAADPLVCRLPGKIAALAVGGAGRYLLLQLKEQRRLAIFDAQRADLSGVVELADDDALIAANADKGFVAYPKLRLIDRIDLESARFDRSAAFPFEATPRVVLAGPASAGPLLAIFHAGRADDSFAQPALGFLDPDTMGPVAPRTFRRKGEKGWVELRDASEFTAGKQSDYAVSSSGDVFWYVPRTPGVVLALVGDRGDMFHSNLPDPGSLATIASRSFLSKSGRFDLDSSPLARRPDPGSILGVISSQDPAYYLLVRSSTPQAARGNPALPTLEVCSAASDRRLFVVNGLVEMKPQMNNVLTLGQRFHLVPAARLIVTIPIENDRLVVRRLDVLGELRRLDVDEVVVTSPPVVAAEAGEPFRHRVEAHARGGATFARSEGPEQLSVTPEGEMRWDVPKDAAGQEPVAVVAVRSASGQTVLHRVHILVRRRELNP